MSPAIALKNYAGELASLTPMREFPEFLETAKREREAIVSTTYLGNKRLSSNLKKVTISRLRFLHAGLSSIRNLSGIR